MDTISPRAVAADAVEVERQALDVIAALVAELRGMPAGAPVSLDDSLERGLGIGSLERVELFQRLERRFGIRIGDTIMAEADTPADLVSAIVAAAPAKAERGSQPRAPLVPGLPAPDSAGTLVEVLRWHADAHADRTHIFLREDDGEERPITYGALWNEAAAVAAGLHENGLARGESVALMLRTERAFFSAFFGTLLAGGVPVPIYPPVRASRIEEFVQRQAAILRNAEARVLITFAEVERIASLLRGQAPSVRVVTSVDRLARPSSGIGVPHLAPESPALIQYTSGSTGDPKGVLLSHANLLANLRAIGEALAIGPDDVTVSWLPLYHDMGLIGAWLGSLYFGVPVAILSPLAFLSHPARWLWTLHAHRGTLSPAPNFAYDLCARKVRDDEIQGLDLSAWRLALNGSEPVSPETIERFSHRFASFGFRPEAMCPVYGLAESSVGLTVSPVGRGPRVDRVAREPFERSRAVRPASPDDQAPLCFVSCGRPLAGHELRIVDDGGAGAGERVEGRVEFRGPSVTHGYFHNPEATRAVLHEGWMDSGDLGYWADGEIFITGRRKDLIIQAGRNLSPQEVEDAAGTVPGIRRGCIAAFGVPDPRIGTERLVIVAETREFSRARRDLLGAAVRDRVATLLDTPPDVVVIADAGTVLKTSSGKIRRSATREAYMRGALAPGRQRSVAAQWMRMVLRDYGTRGWRVVRAGGGLAYTSYVVGLLLPAVPLLWVLLLASPRGRAIGVILRHWCLAVIALSGCRLRVTGLEHLRDAGPAILAANHASYLDSVALLAALPPGFRFVSKRQLTVYPIVGTTIRKAGYLTIDRTEFSDRLSGAERIATALREGDSVFVFPEGTFVRAAGLLPFRLGAFKAAVDAGRPVVPIGISGTRAILPADAISLRRGTIEIAVGAPIAPEGTDWDSMVQLRHRVRERIASLSGEVPVEAPVGG